MSFPTALIEEGVSDPSRPLIELDADLTEDANYGVRRLVVTREAVAVTLPGGAELLRVPIADLTTARHEPLVSGGRLLLRTKTGEEIPAVTYSLSHAHQFSEAARGIEQLAKGEELLINLNPEQTRCTKCGRLLPEKDGVCPSCINRGKTLLRVAGYLGPYKKQALTLAGVAVVQTGINLVPPQIQRHIVDSFQFGRADVGLLVRDIGLWLLIIAVATVLDVWRGRTNAFLAASISADLRSAVYRAVEFLNLKYFDKKPVGAIASRVTNDTERLWFFLVDGLPYLVINLLILVGVAVFLLLTNWALALAILTPIPLMLGIGFAFWGRLGNMFHRVSQKMARLHMHLNESLHGIRVVKAFVKENDEYERFRRRNHEWRDAAMRSEQTWVTSFGLMTFCVALGTLIHWGYGGWLTMTGKLTLGQFFMVHLYLQMIYGPLQWFAQINNWFSRAMAGAERVFEVLDMTPETKSGLVRPIVGAVEFENVRFGYDKSNPVIKGVSFKVKPGEMIGLVGHSGAGKSTTINLIARFYEPDVGSIKIDGVDYRDLDLSDYRQQIGIVLQEPFLFNGTIAENIAYGKPGATFEEIMVAAKAANAHDFILSKADGYDTFVGERGGRLSGGERQRVSIARAILHDPKILILDEATSSVDVETEKQIQEAISHLVAGRTTFAIAHRLSTLRNANRLFVLEHGSISEEGTHEELLAKNGTFKKLVDTQSQINAALTS
ncbi:MAG: ABC transporter ATP-binding protein [Fimbriimonadaceae bacterium]|nr:ABC transporter ATP-binding protein [Fimbriimonadaceae bacterium]QYK56895.1 MAG: ABC transporter ATP-binding protein [Fimbriimonadaceae bacterium]